HMAELNSVMHESFTGNRVVKAYTLEDSMLAQFKEAAKKFVNHTMRVVRANEIPSQLTEFAGIVGATLVLLYAVFQVTAPTSGDFVSFLLTIVLMYQPIKSLVKLQNQLHQASAASQKVFDMLDLKSSIQDPPNPVPLKAAHADIEFQNLEFAYGEQP